MRESSWIIAGVAAVWMGCAAQTPVTTWGYSSWISKDGVPAEAAFEEARETCLAQTGVRDPASVPVSGEQEREFVDCMSTARWCTVARGCD